MSKFKGEMSIGKFCETERKTSDPLQEESVILSFQHKKADELGDEYENGCALVGMTPGKISAFVGQQEEAGITNNGFSGNKAGIYNIKIEGYEFIGNKFTSFTVKRVKKVGSIIILLRLKLQYDKAFHANFPSFIKKVLDIEITEVNQQGTLSDLDDETPDQDSQPEKTGGLYSLGRTCEDDDCEEPIQDRNKTGRCKAHR